MHDESIQLITQIEQLAMLTWPAEHVQDLEHWKMRASRGHTKRANSVFTIGEFPKSTDWLEQIEAFYKNQGLPTVFHLSDASPSGLDQLLEERNYCLEIPCQVMTAPSKQVVESAHQGWIRNSVKRESTLSSSLHDFSQSIKVVWKQTPDERWLESFMRIENFPQERYSFYERMFPKITADKGFVELHQEDQIVAIGTAIAEQGWAGFVNVAVSEDHRGKGLSYKLMQSLAEWSKAHDAEQLYLQVIAENKPAVRLYRNIGYKPFYTFHYRSKYEI
jgi:GNAT superfamily N-acetyltransferase